MCVLCVRCVLDVCVERCVFDVCAVCLMCV